ncbi:hypothetical protein BHE74_00054071 [Ensete ventricosum]|nr:hypothetical protein BHE74_00054071 [Ensete ventricosum]
MSGIEISVLLDKSKELDQLRKEQEEVHQEINKIHKKLQSSTSPPILLLAPFHNSSILLLEFLVLPPETSDAILIKLRQLYCHAKDLSENEVSEQKKKRMKSDSDIARFPPNASMRSQLEHAANQKGEQYFWKHFFIFQVAARVSSDDAEKDEWFIVKVINFDKDTKE